MTTTQILITIFGCAGFWTFATEVWKSRTSKEKKQEEMRKMVCEAIKPIEQSSLALSKDRLLHLCNTYLKDGCITTAQLESLNTLYEAYVQLGGNGTIKRLYEEVLEMKVEVE